MRCSLCGRKATHAYKKVDGSWSGRCADCYHRSTPTLKFYLKRLVPMVCGREV